MAFRVPGHHSTTAAWLICVDSQRLRFCALNRRFVHLVFPSDGICTFKSFPGAYLAGCVQGVPVRCPACMLWGMAQFTCCGTPASSTIETDAQNSSASPSLKTLCILQIRGMTKRSHERWTSSEEQDLVRRFRKGAYPSEIAKDLGRSELAVRGRLAKFCLLPPISAEDIEKFREIRSDKTKAESESEDAISVPTHLKLQVGNASEQFEAALDVQQAFHRFHFVYGIVNPNGNVYIGYSHDVWHRISQHNRNLGAVTTRNSGPWFPFAIYCFAAEVDARAMETLIRRDFEAYALRVEVSLREVLAQIGVSITPSQLQLV